jgi:hypothetical protein
MVVNVKKNDIFGTMAVTVVGAEESQIPHSFMTQLIQKGI